MMRSLFAGVSGMKNHQVRMDVIGNNIANVNTVAFKAGRVSFKEGFAQLLQGASRPTETQGGTNPMQIGLGVQLGSIDTMFTQGNLETTGMVTDLAIQGDSFFLVRNGAQQYYTRAGNFALDASGQLVMPSTGWAVMGRMFENGVALDGLRPVQLGTGATTPARATESAQVSGNLNASAPIYTGTFDAIGRSDSANASSFASTSINTYDSLGAERSVKLYMYKTAENEWRVDAEVDGGAAQSLGNVTFGSDGNIVSATLADVAVPGVDGSAAGTIALDLGSGISGLTQFAGENTAVLRDQDGYAVGTLVEFTIDRAGVITGSFSNGVSVAIAQIALADFNNAGGLQRLGDNVYGTTGNSGEALVGYSGEGSTSAITAGAIEMSNVDLAQEFTNMIITQRGFQANSRVITNVDEMLQEVVNLKR
ncbi:MAG TPA: flagellar hook protein FlgE [Gemmatimonadales bacterium]|nr:flagellar hook protein FlgE [Gemmatimonadales bacterium]